MKIPKNLSESEIQSLLNDRLDKVSEDVVKSVQENSLLFRAMGLGLGILALTFSGTLVSALLALFEKVFHFVYNLIP